MRSIWAVFGVALCVWAGSTPGVEVWPRAAAWAIALCAMALRRDFLLLGVALLVGLTSADRVSVPALEPGQNPSAEQVVALQLDTTPVDGRGTGWVRTRGGEIARVRITGLRRVALSDGARLLARVRIRDLRRRPGPDRRDALRTALARGVASGVQVVEVLRVINSGSPGFLERVRTSWGAGLDRRLGGSAALWKALIWADAKDLDDAVRRRVQGVGMAHLLALSGLHAGIVAGVLVWPWRHRGRRALLVALPVLTGWVALAGAGASLTRAVGMMAWWSVARISGRRADPVDAIGAAALLELALRPRVLCGVGWWLSYAATLAVVVAARKLVGRPLLVQAPLISLAAQFATLPWAIDAFGAVSWLAPLTLLVVGPVFAGVLVGGLLCVGAGSLFPWLAPWVDPLAVLLAHGFGMALRLVSFSSAFRIHLPGFDGGQWALVCALWACLWWPCPVGPRVRAAAAAILALPLLFLLTHGPVAEYILFDVGQGDGAVLRFRRDFLVIDAGPRYGETAPAAWTLVDYLDRRRAERVKIVLTHGHLDHTGGLPELLASGRTDTIIVAAADSGKAWVRRVRAGARASGATLVFAAEGDRILLGNQESECLWPPVDPTLGGSNNRSLVLRWNTPAGALMATGDLEREGEAGVLAGPTGRRPVLCLKVAHHGGNTGTDSGWLDALRPDEALISCGAGNRYGHPHPKVLNRLRASGARIHRTDQCGFLRLRWSGDRQSVHLDCGRGAHS